MGVRNLWPHLSQAYTSHEPSLASLEVYDDSTSLHQRRAIAGHKRSTVDETLSISASESSSRGTQRLQDRSAIFGTRFDFALVIIGFQTGVIQLMFIVRQVEEYSGVIVFLASFLLSIFISLPFMVHQFFYGFYNKFGYIKFWNMAPVGFGIGLSMALYSVYECVVWAPVAGLLILNICHIPFQTISEWNACEKIKRPEGVLCYDAESKLPPTLCELTTYPGLEFYKEITYKPQLEGNGFNGAWFVCCFIVWLVVFVMVSQGFRRLKHILIKIPILYLLSLTLLVVFSFGSQRTVNTERNKEIFHFRNKPTRYTLIWLVWHAIRIAQIPLGTLVQLGSYSPARSSLHADAVMIILFVCISNSAFVYFAHSCHTWIGANFIAINHDCLSQDEMTTLFASLPTAISFLPMGSLWLFVFFASFALKTILQIVITLTATMNAMSEMFHLHRHRQQIVAILCTVGLLLNLPLTVINCEMFFKQTNYFVELLVDLSIVSCTGAIIVCFYTLSRVFDDIHFVYKVEPVMFQKFSSYLSPVLMIFVFITAFTSMVSKWPSEPVFSTDPWAAPFIGFMVFLLLAPIPAYAFYTYIVHLIEHNLSAMLQPTVNWGPPEPDLKDARLNFNPRCELRYKSKRPCTHNCLLNNLRIKIEIEKRDSQRKEFFLNVLQISNYAEWDDDENWHCEGDIIRKARAINWSSDFRRVSNPLMVNERDEEQRQSEVERLACIGDVEDSEEDGDLDEDVEEDVKVEGNTSALNVDVDETSILEENREIETEMESEPDIILPDLNLRRLDPKIRYLDARDIVERPLPLPRYSIEHRTYPRPRESRREQPAEIPMEPISRQPRSQSKTQSCQTGKGLKHLKNLARTVLPWPKSNRKKYRCSEKNRDGHSEPSTSNDSSEGSESLTRTKEWP